MTPDTKKTFRISYFGPIRIFVGGRSEDAVTLDAGTPATVMNIMRALTQKYGAQLEQLVFHDGAINRALNVFVNGRCLIERMEFTAELPEDEPNNLEILLVSQASGGSSLF